MDAARLAGIVELLHWKCKLRYCIRSAFVYAYIVTCIVTDL